MPVVGYVVSGRVLVAIDGHPPQEVAAGQTFYAANVMIRHFDNVSTTEMATFVAFYLLGKDDREVIRLLQA